MLNNFIYAKKKSLFTEALNNGEVLDEAIAFIEDTKEIWNHGTYFGGTSANTSTNTSNIEEFIQNIIKDKADKSELPTNTSDLTNDSGFITINDIIEIIDISYSDLVYARDNNNLIPGKFYRIIDFVTTTNGRESSRSANHKFDIIVQALSSNTLTETAKACNPKIVEDDYTYDVTTPYFGYNLAPTNWSNLSTSNVPKEIIDLGFSATNNGDVKHLTIDKYNSNNIHCVEGSIKVIWQWQNGAKKINILGVELIRKSDNVVLDSDFHIGSTGTYNNNNIYTLVVPNADEYIFKFYIDGKTEEVNSSCTVYGYHAYDYFKNSKLNTWDIKYCLDNDTSRFRWAASGGKGVVYYMKDEYCNEAFYDFKNILFNSKYTFNYNINGVNYDGSVKYGTKCNHNSIESDMIASGSYKGLSKIYFENTSDSSECNNNIIKNNCWDIHFGDNCYSNNIGVSCEKIYFGNNMNDIHIGSKCTNIAFVDSNGNNLQACRMIELGDQCSNINIISISETSYNENKWVQNIKISNNVTGNVYVDVLNNKRTLCVTASDSGELIKTYESDLFNKQDVISDIEEIRTNANSGAEALQLLDQKQNVLVDGLTIRTINGESLLGEGNITINGSGVSEISGLINLKDPESVKAAQLSLADKQHKTFIVTDSDGNYPSPLVNTIYLDDVNGLMDLFYRGNDLALRHIINNGEAYYKYLGMWSSENIRKYVKLPQFNMQTVKVGDLVTIIRHDFTSDEFYSKYIDFNSIVIDNSAFQTAKTFAGYGSESDGEYIKHMMLSGNIYSAESDPNKSSVTTYPLSIDGKVQFYTAQITPNTQKVYSGEFWTGNMTGPGIYSYVTTGRPAGSDDGEYYIGYVSPNGTQSLVSMLNPYKVFVRSSINDEWVNIAEQLFGEISDERFPSIPGWLVDVDNCLDNGVHPTCSTQSILNPSRSSISAPSDLKWSNNYFTCLVNRTSTNDGTYDTIEQTAYGRKADEGQIYKRIIFLGPDTQYGPWINIVGGGTGGISGTGTYPEINHGTLDTTFNLTPNTFHIWGEVPSLYISFAPEIEGIANEYIFQFSSGSTPTQLNIDGNIKWADLPNMSANKTYQISVLKGLASIIEFS